MWDREGPPQPFQGKKPITGEPWAKQAGESAAAWQAFVRYRDMGAGRSTAKVAQALGKSKALMDRWCNRWSWVARAEAWDEELDRQRRDVQARAVREMAERQAKAGMVLQARGLEGLKFLSSDKLSAADAVRLVMEGAKLERLARGEPGEPAQEDGDPALVKVETHQHYHIVQQLTEDPQAREALKLLHRRMRGIAPSPNGPEDLLEDEAVTGTAGG